MRRIFYLLSLIILLMNGCSRPPAQTSLQPKISQSLTPIFTQTTFMQQTPSIASNIFTSEPTIVITPIGTETPTPSATSVPTIKPTFDTSRIQTATLTSAAICPPKNNSLKLVIKPEDHPSYVLWDGWKKFENTILEYLNRGGSYENMGLDFSSGIVHLGNDTSTSPALKKDITNDGIPEIIAVNPFYSDKDHFTGGGAIYVFSCDRGTVKTLFFKSLGVVANKHTLHFTDINNDGVPEMILTQIEDSRLQSSMIFVYEWTGNTMASVLSIPYFINNDLYYTGGQADLSQLISHDFFLVERIAKFEFKDMNNDGVPELVVHLPDIRYTDGPSRNPTIIYAWDGQHFTLYRTLYPSPTYRYQAVQDADSAALFGENEKALELYLAAIFDKNLLWYSPKVFSDIGEDWYKKTPAPIEYQNPNEYPLISAYSSFRMMIIHFLLGDQEAALNQYNQLLKDHPLHTFGHPFVELATDFFVAFQQTKDWSVACDAAINYAARHPEILSVLGDKNHGEQSQRYKPIDICPYR